MHIPLKIELERADGEIEKIEVTADARDVRGYETEYKVSWLSTELSFVQLSQLAWITARRQKKFTGSYDVWDAQAIDVTSGSGDEAGEISSSDPIQPEATESPSFG